MSRLEPTALPPSDKGSDPPSVARAVPLDDWDLTDQLDRIERVLAKQLPEAQASNPRLDPPHFILSDVAAAATGPPTGESNPEHPHQARPADNPTYRAEAFPKWPVAAWSAVSLGLLSITLTVGLLAWNTFGNSAVPTQLVLPLLLTGQTALIVGWALMTARWWRAAAAISHQVHRLESQLGQVETSTERLAGSVSGSASGFYARMAQGASPHLLLADIKGQLDQLAMRMIADK